MEKVKNNFEMNLQMQSDPETIRFVITFVNL